MEVVEVRGKSWFGSTVDADKASNNKQQKQPTLHYNTHTLPQKKIAFVICMGFSLEAKVNNNNKVITNFLQDVKAIFHFPSSQYLGITINLIG